MTYTHAPSTGGLIITHPAPLEFTSTKREQGVFLLSDLHIGAANADYKMMERELQVAASRGDRIVINGDLFDMILAHDAKRFTPSVLHKRLRGCEDLINRAVEWGVELLEPYAKLIDAIGVGNHETSVGKYHNCDPIALLLSRLHTTNPRISHAGYSGFIRYSAQLPRLSGARKQVAPSFTLFYWHGAGGGAGLGGALGEFGSKGGFIEGADAVWYAHKHVRVVSQLERLSCPRRGHRPRVKTQWLIRTGGYLQPYGGQSQGNLQAKGRRGNYSADALHTPFARGGVRLVLFTLPDDPTPTLHSRIEVS